MALVQIEESLLLEILDRANYLASVMHSLNERVRNREMSDWLTLEDLCGLLLPYYRLDGKVLYEESDIEDFLMSSYRPKF